MTIDEVILKQYTIASLYELGDGFDVYSSEHRQIAEWLEELKAYKEQHLALCDFHNVNTIEDIYNKAIDDFEYACVLKGEQDERYGCLDDIDIRHITKQLKEGNNYE